MKETGRIDWFNTDAQSLSFAHLKRIGIITTADYKKVPYTKTDILDRAQLTMLILQEIVMIQQLSKEITDITARSVQAGASAVTETATVGIFTANLTADIINTIAEVIYIGTLIGTIVLHANEIFDQIVQTKRYKYAMRLEDLLKKACIFLSQNGSPISLSSTIFQSGPYKDVTIMPRKIVMPKSGQSILFAFERDANEVNTSKSYGHFDGTLKELIDGIDVLFNTTPVVDSGKLNLQERNSYLGTSSFVLPDTGPEGYTFNYPDPHGHNAAKLAAIYMLRYATDQSDLNTIHQYQGTSIEVSMLPTVVTNRGNLLMGGLNRKNVPFAHAKRKEFLSYTEQTLSVIVNVINGAINAIIGVINTV